MITLRRAKERGHARHGWLDSHHTFSFAGYHDPEHMGFRVLRVINEDVVQPKRGFDTHSHRDMEILTWVLEGALEHRDSLGTGSVIRPGDIQRMSAGTGVSHSEYNHSATEPVHLLQIWLLPERDGLPPSYEQKTFPPEQRRGALRLLASRDGRAGSVRIHQDVELHTALLGAGEAVEHRLRPGRHAWVQLARGRCQLDGVTLEAGDGAAVSREESLRLAGADDSEVLLFDLP
jgi:redox-sensitive bicupin YhaK (pirin superfamily)